MLWRFLQVHPGDRSRSTKVPKGTTNSNLLWVSGHLKKRRKNPRPTSLLMSLLVRSVEEKQVMTQRIYHSRRWGIVLIVLVGWLLWQSWQLARPWNNRIQKQTHEMPPPCRFKQPRGHAHLCVRATPSLGTMCSETYVTCTILTRTSS